MTPLWLQLLVGLAGAGMAKLIVDRLAPSLHELLRWAIYLGIMSALIVANHSYDLSLIAPRHLTDQQKQVVLNALLPLCKDKSAGSVESMINLVWQPAPESTTYANDFMTTLNATKCWAGYRSSISEQYDAAVNPVGLLLACRDWRSPPKVARVLAGALDEAKIKYERVDTTDRLLSLGVSIVVGSKP